MEIQSTMKYLAFGIVLFIIGGIVGVAVDPYLPASISNSQKGYQTGFSAAEKRAQESSSGSVFRVSSDVRTLSGTVTAIQGSTLSVRTMAVDPFADPALNDRTITIAPDTKLVRIVQKDPKVFQSELAASAKSSAAGKSTPAPLPFTEVAITVADIRIGDSFTVTASENVKTALAFTAQSIQIQSSAAPK